MSEPISIEDILEAAAFLKHSQEQRGKGPAPKTHCIRGHDLTAHGKQRWKVNDAGQQVRNGRYCGSASARTSARVRPGRTRRSRGVRVTTRTPRTTVGRADS